MLSPFGAGEGGRTVGQARKRGSSSSSTGILALGGRGQDLVNDRIGFSCASGEKRNRERITRGRLSPPPPCLETLALPSSRARRLAMAKSTAGATSGSIVDVAVKNAAEELGVKTAPRGSG